MQLGRQPGDGKSLRDWTRRGMEEGASERGWGGGEGLAIQEARCAPGMEGEYVRRVPDTPTWLQPCCHSPGEQASYLSTCALSTVWHRACCRYHEMVQRVHDFQGPQKTQRALLPSGFCIPGFWIEVCLTDRASSLTWDLPEN